MIDVTLTEKNLDYLEEFWNDIGRVVDADPEDLQNDILAYVRQMRYYRRLAEQRGEALEYIADIDNCFENLPEYARKSLEKEQPND